VKKFIKRSSAGPLATVSKTIGVIIYWASKETIALKVEETRVALRAA
jgi:hypothetical protein